MLASQSFRHPQYTEPRVNTVQGLQKVPDSGGEKLKTPSNGDAYFMLLCSQKVTK